MSIYTEKLKHPKWQKKRLEILSRDNFTCRRCDSDSTTLHVHHKIYEKGKEPWEYDEKLLITLCADCHESESEFLKFAPYDLQKAFLAAGFFALDFSDLIEGLGKIKLQHSPEVVLSAYGWSFENPEMQKIIIESYFKNLSSINKSLKIVFESSDKDYEPF